MFVLTLTQTCLENKFRIKVSVINLVAQLFQFRKFELDKRVPLICITADAEGGFTWTVL